MFLEEKDFCFYSFYRFYAIFVKFSTDFVDLNVENAQHGTSSMSSRFFRREKCCFSNEKISN